jgi:membrane associated rhomboid family serine protease
MIRVREASGDAVEAVYSTHEFERRVRRGEISPHSWVSVPALTGDAFVEARTLPLFTEAFDPQRHMFRRHFHVGRLPVVTGLVVVLCVALWWYTRRLGDGVVTREALLALGAKARARIVDEGQTWRLLTAGVLHKDATHLAFNLFALASVGVVLESIYRRGETLLLLITSSIACMVASTLASATITVGASGMVFGCLGCAVVFGLRFADVLSLRYRLYFGVVIVGYTMASFWLGMMRASTDNWGHAGGMAAGVLWGALLQPRLLRLKTVTENRREVMRPFAWSVVVVFFVVAAGPVLPWWFVRFEQEPLAAFGIVVNRPATWNKGPDPLGFLAFGNGVDALVSFACTKHENKVTLEQATTRFLDGELAGLSRAGHIAGLVLESTTDATVGQGEPVPAQRVRVRFMASDGPFLADAWVFVRGEMACTAVAATRVDATEAARMLALEAVHRMRFSRTTAEEAAMQTTALHPESTQAWLERALAHQGVGALVDARAAFERASACAVAEPGWISSVAAARGRFELDQGGLVVVAQQSAARAVAYAPNDAEAHALLVESLRRSAAQDHLEQARSAAHARFPDDPRFQP